MNPEQLLTQVLDGKMLDFGRVVNLCHLLMQTASVPGAVVEFGCYKGDTARLMREITRKDLWLYDSFEGLPEPGKKDVGASPAFIQGAMAVDAGFVVSAFDGLPMPQIFRAWFNELTPDQLPPSIAFAHLDCDLYQSIMDALKLVYPRLSTGAICLIDDYEWEHLPGVKIATHEFLSDKPEYLVTPAGTNGMYASHAYFVKL
jgi:O-methyltransferase